MGIYTWRSNRALHSLCNLIDSCYDPVTVALGSNLYFIAVAMNLVALTWSAIPESRLFLYVKSIDNNMSYGKFNNCDIDYLVYIGFHVLKLW
jgi:hypothetical protein